MNQNDNKRDDEGQVTPQSNPSPKAQWQHRSQTAHNNINFQNNPQANGQGQPNNYSNYPPRQAMPGSFYMPKEKKKSSLLPVLLSIFLTFVITSSAVWVLASRGFLPGTEKNIMRSEMPEGYEVGDFGLSIHSSDPEAKKSAEELAEVLKTLEDNYFKVLSPSEIMEAMRIGVVNEMGSKYTYFLSKDEVDQFYESMSGNYSGIGATVSQDETSKRFSIVNVIENGPAFKAGLLAEDIILAVDGRDTNNFATAAELANNVKGEDGTTVVLTVERDGEKLDISIVRGIVQVEVIHTRMLNDNIGYMHISEFTNNLPDIFEAAMSSLLDKGAQQVVFDLRGNPGGSADAVVDVLDRLLPEALIATVRGRQKGEIFEEVWQSDNEMMVPTDMRYAILVNGSSASASELFSGVLQDHGKAYLIGSTTYGKGSGTVLFKLKDGSGANVTIFNYFLPSGRLIEETGLEPDLAADEIASEYRGTPYYNLKPEQDDALAKALEYLSQFKKGA